MTEVMQFPLELPMLYTMLEEHRSQNVFDIDGVLDRAVAGNGLNLEEAALLLSAPSDHDQAIFDAAVNVNLHVKSKSVTFYGVVYIHDFCINKCTYCGDSAELKRKDRKLLSLEEFERDVLTLLERHPLKEICFLMGEAASVFSTDQLIKYLKLVAQIYRNKIILNIPPLSVEEFSRVRRAVPDNRLHFRVFQETYDEDAYARHHTHGPKMDRLGRIDAQRRALQAGFDEAGHGVLYGLNHRSNGHNFDTLAMLAHAMALHDEFGKWSQSMSFPRLQPAPLISLRPPRPVVNDALTRCVSVVKLSLPWVDTVITCRESAAFRRAIRPIVNIEDFAARPGPGGNMNPETHQQMYLPDMRAGEAVRAEMEADGYKVR